MIDFVLKFLIKLTKILPYMTNLLSFVLIFLATRSKGSSKDYKKKKKFMEKKFSEQNFFDKIFLRILFILKSSDTYTKK